MNYQLHAPPLHSEQDRRGKPLVLEKWESARFQTSRITSNELSIKSSELLRAPQMGGGGSRSGSQDSPSVVESRAGYPEAGRAVGVSGSQLLRAPASFLTSLSGAFMLPCS